jgi:hypothetical protein
MTPVDLPEPRRLSRAPRDPVRSLELCLAFLWLVALYAFVHKLAIPVFLRFAAGRSVGIDPWFIHPWLLLSGIKRAGALSPATSFLAGAGIAQGVFEAIAAFNGVYRGWAVFSHLLSSIPISVVCVALLTGPLAGKSAPLAWIGALAAAVGALL